MARLKDDLVCLDDIYMTPTRFIIWTDSQSKVKQKTFQEACKTKFYAMTSSHFIFNEYINKYGGAFCGGIHHGGVWRGGVFHGGVWRGVIFRGGVPLVPNLFTKPPI